MILIAGKSVILAGNLDAKLGKVIISYDIHDVSPDGRHLMNLINNCELVIMNFREIFQGIFTRVNNKISRERSVLGYVVVTTDLCSSIISMIVNEEKLCTTWRSLKMGKGYTYHNTIIFRLNVPSSHKKGRKTNKHTIWNFNPILPELLNTLQTRGNILPPPLLIRLFFIPEA